MSLPVPRALPRSKNPLHLYRALLRECTYLPDAEARAYGRAYIGKRFRARATALPARAESAICAARRALSLLIRANEGERNALQRVLFLAYGRARHRKAEFIRDYRKMTEEMDESFGMSLEEAVQPGKDIQLPPSLKLLHQTQSTKGPPEHRFRLQRIAAVNAKGRPMPEIRLPKLRRNALKPLSTKLLAPLPLPTWQHLYEKVMLKAPVEPFVRRRTAAGSTASPNVYPSLTLEKLEAAPGREKFTMRKPHRKVRPITPRRMRRLWATILATSPRVSQDEPNQWKVSYFSKRELRPLVADAAHPVFARVTNYGRTMDNVGFWPEPAKKA